MNFHKYISVPTPVQSTPVRSDGSVDVPTAAASTWNAASVTSSPSGLPSVGEVPDDHEARGGVVNGVIKQELNVPEDVVALRASCQGTTLPENTHGPRRGKVGQVLLYHVVPVAVILVVVAA